MSGLTKWEGGKRKKMTRWDNGREKGLLNRQRRKRRKDLCLEREEKISMLTFWVNNSIFHNHYPHTQTYILHTLSIPFTSCCVIFLYKRAAEGFLNILLGEKKVCVFTKGPPHISKPQNLYVKVYTHLICHTYVYMTR